MKNKKALALLLTGAMVAGLVTGCGSSSSDNTTTPETTATTEANSTTPIIVLT